MPTQNNESNQLRRVLSLDGGGIKGAFIASFLTTLEKSIGDKVVNYFDLIAGTSTGGIIALGLGLGFPASHILEFYKQDGPRIFGGSHFLKDILGIGFSKFNHKRLRHALENRFEDKLLGNSLTRLVVPATRLDAGKVYLFKTAHHAVLERDYKVRAVDVALATSAAPTFFAAHKTPVGTHLVDGGIWASNPSGIAAVEAVGMLRWDRQQVKVLSIGCPESPLNIGFPGKLGVLAWWTPRALDFIMSSQSSAAKGIARILLSHEQFYRIAPTVPPGRFKLHSHKRISELISLGEETAFAELQHVRPLFIDAGHREPFVPLRNP